MGSGRTIDPEQWINADGEGKLLKKNLATWFEMELKLALTAKTSIGANHGLLYNTSVPGGTDHPGL